MNDYDKASALRTVLLAGLGGTPVLAMNQPTIQGRPSCPAVLFSKVGGDRRYGWVQRTDTPDEDDPTLMVHREVQFYESTYQFEAVGPSAAPGAAPPTATPSDLVNLAAAVLQSDTAITALRALGLGVLRVSQVRNPFMQNDRDQYEAVPSFDLVVTHEQVMLSVTPAAVVGELRMARV